MFDGLRGEFSIQSPPRRNSHFLILCPVSVDMLAPAAGSFESAHWFQE